MGTLRNKLWHELDPGTVFCFDNKLYLRSANGILSFEDYREVVLHNDVQVVPVGELHVFQNNNALGGVRLSYSELDLTLEDLLEEVNRIVASDLSWEDKFDLVFSDRIFRQVQDELHLEYADPDTTYQEDVMAFVSAFREKMAEKQR